MTDTPLTAADLDALMEILRAQIDQRDNPERQWVELSMRVEDAEGLLATIAALTTRAEQAEARVAELTAALTEQGLLQNTATGVIWHVHDCPASFDFAECNYRCRVAREAFARAGTEPYVSQETRRDTEVYE